MDSKEDRIAELESKNSELAKEILLNESALYETENEIEDLDKDLLEHEIIQQYVNNLRFLIGRITKQKDLYKQEVYKNNLEIMNSKEDIKVKKAERKLKKLETLLEDRLDKTNIAMRKAKEIGKEIKKLRTYTPGQY